MSASWNETITERRGSHAEAELRDRLCGEVLRRSDEGYENARGVWNGMIDRYPSLIARCTGVADVMAAVGFAREQGMQVAVRAGGHSVAGHSTCDGGLVIDLSPMRAVHVDSEARTVRVGGGATWGEVDRETQRFGLATPGGLVSTTGVAGLTLGGGYGWLRRRYGLSCDNLTAAEVVTADGRLVETSESENPELLWALKGGGGNFGVVTALEFRLHPVGPELMHVARLFPLEEAGAMLRAWRELIADAPDEVTSDATFWSVPPDPALPAKLHGTPVLVVEAVHSGSVDEGERALRPLRQLGEPLLDLSGPKSYTTLNSAVDALFPAGALHCYWKSAYLTELGDAAVDALVAHCRATPSPLSPVPLRHLGGAISRVGPNDTAMGDRSAPYLLSIDATWTDPADAEANIAWTRAFWTDMQRFSNGATYFNFPGLLEEGEDLLRKTFGANYERLLTLKRRYDPTNLFRLNHNIDPEAS